MKSTDLQRLTEAALEALALITSAGLPLRDQSFLSLTSEAECTYLADCKSAYHQSVTTLLELTRQCESAIRLWQSLESDESRLLGPTEAATLEALYHAGEK